MPDLLEKRVASLGRLLTEQMSQVLRALPGSPQGPVQVAKAVGVDKVFTSRMLRAASARDPVAAMQVMPGPDPIRNFAEAAGRRGVPATLVRDLVDSCRVFDEMIREEAGSRSGFDAILASWLPEARAEFELRRKQTIYRAFSELKGKSAQVNLATAMIYPSADGEHLDLVWILGHLGLQRLRPGVTVKFASRRVAIPHGDKVERKPRRPRTLDGIEVEGLDGLMVPEHSSAPLPTLRVERVNEVVHYVLGDDTFGPKSCRDLVFTEVNANELPRYVSLEPRRKRYVYIDITTPVELLVFDLLIHADVLGNSDPGLLMYDTGSQGIADINDRSRDIDRMDHSDTLQPLGRGTEKYRISEVPRYVELLQRVCRTMDWDEHHFRGFRTRIDFPLYGSQVAITYDAQARPQ